ncbi:hypothetical protein, partial [Serratia marcescens]|uniref:hypothetical protein n=1 Tax=Serratia marcescens TaxID=615 RepID=UPI0023800B27
APEGAVADERKQWHRRGGSYRLQKINLDLKIQFVLFCIDCKPRGPTFGHTDQKTATVGGSIAVFGENNHKPVV